MSSLAGAWRLEPEVVFLNHGSFGAAPRAVLERQGDLRAAMEAAPVRFLARELEGRLDAARIELAAFLGADPAGLAFVPNATTAVNTVLRGLPLQPGDELLTTDHAYPACRNALEAVARGAGARVVAAAIPFPAATPETAASALLAAVTPRTRAALLDHVTSPTALVLPLERLVPALRARGVRVLIDGAHAPGMLPLALDHLGADFYAGNCHKWLCAPKGAGFLWVRAEHRATLHPLVTSHGATADRPERSRLHLEFDWTGTVDPTPWLCVPAAIRHLAGLVPGGWPEVMRHNRELALGARAELAAALELEPPCPDAMLGAMAALPLPDGDAAALQARLYERHRIEVPVIPWPHPPRRLVRISAQLYNRPEQYRRLAAALREELSR